MENKNRNNWDKFCEKDLFIEWLDIYKEMNIVYRKTRANISELTRSYARYLCAVEDLETIEKYSGLFDYPDDVLLEKYEEAFNKVCEFLGVAKEK
jgi:hypothetical protein